MIFSGLSQMRNLAIALSVALLWASPAVADPVTLIIAAATAAGTTGLAYLAGQFAAGVAFSTVFGYFAAAFGLTLAIGYLAQALQPGLSASVNRGYTVAGVSPAADQAIIYGESRVGGIIVYKEVTDNNRWLHQIIAIAGHECDRVTAIYFDDQRFTIDYVDPDASPSDPPSYHSYTTRQRNGRGGVQLSYFKRDKQDRNHDLEEGKIHLEVYLGFDDQKASKRLIAASDGVWTSAHRLQGVCYVYLALKFDSDAWPNGEPNISFKVRGKPIDDPRIEGVHPYWNDNPALVMLDYIRSDYGVNDRSVDTKSFAAAANICDEIVVRDPSLPIDYDRKINREKRYTCNGSFRVGSAVKEVMNDINLSMSGLTWYSQGKWKTKPGHYTPPIETFGEDDMRSALKIVTRKSRRDNFNTVSGLYKGPGTNYTPTDYPAVNNPTFLREDNGIVNTISLDYPMTDSTWTAQRISNLTLRREREQISVTALFGLNAFKVQLGDHILLNNERVGWQEKEFQVMDWKLKPNKKGNVAIEMTLQEISRNVFVDHLARKGQLLGSDEEITSNNTSLFNFSYVPSIGVSAEASTRINNENLINVITITTTTNQPDYLDKVEVWYRGISGNGPTETLVGAGAAGVSEIIDPPPGHYEVFVWGVNIFGVRNSRRYRTRVRVEKDTTVPANVTGFSYSLVDSGLFFEWDASPDFDLSYYRIRHTKEYIDPRYSDAVTVVSKIPRPATSVVLPAVEGTYMIKAIDKSGNQSEQAATVILLAGDLVDFSNSETATESPSFGGVHEGTGVARGALTNLAAFAADPEQIKLEATYTFGEIIDLGAPHRARADVSMEVVRYQNGNTFDDLLGYFDSLGGPFDSLGDLSEHDDINVVQQVSVNDGPSNSVDGWTDYKRFTAGDFYGRSFRFRVVLSSDRAGVTPDIRSLVARVRYES